QLCLRRERSNGDAARGGGAHAKCRRRPAPTASVTKKIALTASTTAPPVGTRNFVDTASPPAPAKNAMAMLHARELRVRGATFRADAAGTTTSASTSSAPMILRLTTIDSVSSTAKKYSRKIDRAPATLASGGLRLSSSRWLYSRTSSTATRTPTIT